MKSYPCGSFRCPHHVVESLSDIPGDQVIKVDSRIRSKREKFVARNGVRAAILPGDMSGASSSWDMAVRAYEDCG